MDILVRKALKMSQGLRTTEGTKQCNVPSTDLHLTRATKQKLAADGEY